MAENTLLDLESMAEETLDNIQEAPDFMNPPAGEYQINVKDCVIDKYKNKKEEDCQRLKLTYEIQETVSIADPKEQPVPNGSLFTETFQGTEQGLSFFKKRIREIMNVDDMTGVSLRDMMSSVKGQSLKVRISIKKTAKKDAPGEFYENLQLRIVKG